MITRAAIGAALFGSTALFALPSMAQSVVSTTAVAAPIAPAGPANAAPWQTALVSQATGAFGSFYAYRSGPLWIASDGSVTPAARTLLDMLRTADFDGLNPEGLGYSRASAAVAQLSGDNSPAARASAELALSQAFAGYVQGMRDTAGSEMIYEHDLLRPVVPDIYPLLEEAAAAPSLETYLADMPWVHPLYAQLRRTVAAGQAADPSTAQAVRANLERLRALPANPGERYILIDSAGARLYMYENGVVVDSMKVVVGTALTPTPIMAGYMRYAVFNPYWNVPTSLIRKNIAPRARAGGQTYLRNGGYQVVSDWVADAEVLPSAGINWAKVESGEVDIRMRQLPRATNSMGKVKYEFPNPQGIYLHDTPTKEYMLKDVRQLSNGCIRLEDAFRFGRWLMGSLPEVGNAPEQKVDLAAPVPIYVTYLTAQPTDGQVAVLSDPYGLDVPGAKLANVPGAVASPL